MSSRLNTLIGMFFVTLFAVTLVACAGVSTRTLPPMASTPAGTTVMQPAPDLYTAGQPTEADWRTFTSAGVKVVINLRTPAEMTGRDERAEVTAADMRYVELPIDGANALTPENARRLGELLRESNGPVLLHCASGNRVGGLLALLKANEGVPVEKALAFGRSAGMKSSETKVRETMGVAPAALTAP